MNNMNEQNKIIVAMSTPYGKSAIAGIRLSGNGCIELVDRRLSRSLKVGKLEYNTFETGRFEEKLMAVCFRAPHSYTGEDMVELYPHGNMTIVDGIVKELISDGARLAERGEFTKRAFLNGKKDLMVCEALADIIDAQTTEQLVYGNKRYDGEFTALNRVKELLNGALSSVEAILHYSDELEENETDQTALNGVYASINEAEEILSAEIKAFAGGKIRRDGFNVVILGAPNVGKSTLLNAMVGSDMAIVTDIAGTTRDALTGHYIYKDRLFTVTDTAGLNDETADVIEKIGIERAKTAAEKADALVYVTCEGAEKENFSQRVDITAINKCDDIAEKDSFDMNESIKISAKFGKNILALKEMLYSLCPKDCGALCNHRQYECAVRCSDALRAAQKEMKGAGGVEIVAALVYEGYSAISELFGEKADEKVIETVFDRFCVGK